MTLTTSPSGADGGRPPAPDGAAQAPSPRAADPATPAGRRPDPRTGGRPDPAGRAGAAVSRGRRLLPTWPTLVLAAVAYLPLLATAPGKIGADTKAYLYLDPGRMLRRAVSMWDPAIGMGTVTHQNIGYLYPQGLFYWLLDIAGLPDWVAQRLWTGSILFGAGAGVLFLLRSFRWPDRFAFVAAAGYMLSPYILEYEARISAILLPYAGLGWLIGITVRGLREAEPGRAGWRPAGWRFPAAFALVVTTIGSINASSLIFILFAPLLWVPFAVWGTREVRLGAAAGMCTRAVLAVLVTSAWWIAGLYTQAGYGLNVLAFTETIETVASSSQASEVLRGLGNWFFYGQDALGPWIGPATHYTHDLWLIVVSFALPILALAAASAIRWGHRGYFVALILLGTTIAVGVYPYDDPSPWGRLFKDFAEGSTAGLALRSLPRAVPMVALGLSVLLAGGLAALEERYALRAAAGSGPGGGGRRAGSVGGGGAARGWRPGVPQLAMGLVLVLIAANMSPLFRGEFVEPLLKRPEQVPAYETQVAKALDAGDDGSRVLELPGADFSHYRWGSTLDPVTEGLMDRPLVLRELIPYGEAGTVDLVRSLDRRMQEGVLETSAVPDLARLMGVGDVMLRSNLAYERYRTPRPRSTWDLFTSTRPAGLGAPQTYGPPVAEDPGIPFTDEITLGTKTSVPDPPALAVFPVSNTQPIVRTATTARPLLVSGNGEALVDAAASGLLAEPVASGRAILYAPELASKPGELAQALDDGADLLVSDTNRLRAERWTGVRENFGYVEQPGVAPLVKDPNDNRLPLFGDETTANETTAALHAPGTPAKIAAVTASAYGNSFAYGPWDRPVRGIDGDINTAWRVGAFTDPTGEAWQTTLAAPTTTDHVRLTQPLSGPRNRYITRATLTFDGGSPVTVDLTPSSRTQVGQVVSFPTRTFRTLHIRVDATNYGRQRTYDNVSAVGFAEVEIPGADGKALTADEVLRMPSDSLDAAGASSLGHRLALQMSRDRANPAEPFKQDTEEIISRSFALPTARTFALTGTARISAYAADDHIDRLLGRPSNLPVVSSSGRLPGSLAARSSSAFDGDVTTAWSPGIGDPEGGWLQVASPAPITTSSVTMSIVADGRHSVPTRIGLVVDGRVVGSVPVPPVTDTAQRGGTRQVTLTFPAVTGSTWRFVVDDVRTVKSIDPISRSPLSMPVGIAEIGLPGLASGVTEAPGAGQSTTATQSAGGRLGPAPGAAPGDLPGRPAEHRRPPGRRAYRRIHLRRGEPPRPAGVHLRRSAHPRPRRACDQDRGRRRAGRGHRPPPARLGRRRRPLAGRRRRRHTRHRHTRHRRGDADRHPYRQDGRRGRVVAADHRPVLGRDVVHRAGHGSPAGDALLAGARREPVAGVEGDGERRRRGPAAAGRRLRQRLADQPDGRGVHRDPDLGAAADRPLLAGAVRGDGRVLPGPAAVHHPPRTPAGGGCGRAGTGPADGRPLVDPSGTDRLADGGIRRGGGRAARHGPRLGGRRDRRRPRHRDRAARPAGQVVDPGRPRGLPGGQCPVRAGGAGPPFAADER
ncbi:alpha-(1-_3)-arabinofuranosyltransferase family protein [Frankia sp. ArI3]|uniref:alpha-(1->3)-arabinofuranosyltransferase domain-containing protein n=1 Tax=Frankia sp. ArI3 TaxID=1858 RepID=UPI00351D5778